DRSAGSRPQHRSGAADLLVAGFRVGAAARPAPRSLGRLLVSVPWDRDPRLRCLRSGGVPASVRRLETAVGLKIADGMKRLLLLLVALMVLAVACGPSPTPAKKSPSPVATTPVARPSLAPFPSPTPGGPTPPPPVAGGCSSQGPAGHQLAALLL